MFARVSSLSDADLTDWDLTSDLVSVRSGPVAYGVILFGKIRLSRAKDEAGEAFIHVRLHDPPTGEGKKDVELHSIWTRVIKEGEETVGYQAIQTEGVPLEFFNE